MLLSSMTASKASPGSPSSAKPGALRRELASAALPSPPLPPLGQHDAGAGADEVGDDPAVGRADDGAGGHAQDLVLAPGAVPVAALARLAVAGLLVRAVVEVEQRVHAGVDLEDDVAAVAAVAAVGAAEGLELLAVDRGHAVAAVAGGHVHGHSIDESGHARAASYLLSATSARAGRPVRSSAERVVVLRPRRR